jgi:hypothetical protein
MFIGVPAVIEVRVVNVNGFCAEVRAASVAMATEAYVEKCIFGGFPSFSSLLNPSLQLSRMQVLKIDTQIYIVYEQQIIYTDASEEKTRERANPDRRSSPREERLFMRPPNSFSTPHVFHQVVEFSFSVSFLAGTMSLRVDAMASLLDRVLFSPLLLWRSPQLSLSFPAPKTPPIEP